MLKKALIVVGALLALVLVAIATRPSTYTVVRSATVKASPAVVNAIVTDFHRWGEWSPWDELDPAMKKTFEGPATGVGAVYSWIGNDQVGEGKMTITAATAEQVDIKLEFLKPFASTSDTSFGLKAAGESTEVTWTMKGTNDFMGKAFSLVMDMDRMIGNDFEKGLAKLGTVAAADAARAAEKAAAEKAAADAAAAAPVEAAPTDAPAVAPAVD